MYLCAKIDCLFFFVGESLLSRIQDNSDGQSNFNLILQKLSILKNEISSNSIFVVKLQIITLVYFYRSGELVQELLVIEIIRMVDV